MNVSPELTTLGSVVKRTGGTLQTGPFGSQLHASDYKSTGTPVVMPVNLGDNEIREDGIARIGASDARRLRRHALRDGDIIFSRRGDVGRRSLVRAKEAGWLCGTGCLAARFGADRTAVNPAYLAEYLGSNAAQTWLIDNAVGGTMPNLNTGILAALPVLLPPKHEQDHIVFAFSDVQQKIESLERLIAKKQAIKQGMMQQLLTGRTRLHGFTDDWIKTELGHVLDFQVGFPFRSEDFATSSPGMRLVRNRDLKSDDSIIFYRGQFAQTYVVQTGDILVGMDGEFTPCRWRSGRALLNQRVGRIRPFRCASDFIYFAIRRPLEELEASTGATTVKHLSHKTVKSLTLPLPSLEEQKAIAAILLDVESEIEILEARLKKAREVKTGMMQQLLTGRARLSSEASE